MLAFLCFVPSYRSNLPTYVINLHAKEGLYETINEQHNIFFKLILLAFAKIPYINQRFYTGEYYIFHYDTAFDVILRIMHGQNFIRKITIPEGYTVKMIVEKLQENPFLLGEIDTIPEEGSLFPDTYYYKRDTSRADIIYRMQKKMEFVKNELLGGKDSKYIKKIMILASIIEKESKHPNDRRLVSSVFHNRMNRNMRLQSCPTVIYAISNGYGKINRKLTYNDLHYQSPYNTYRNDGLPPTPICCPSRDSIMAAISPAKTDYLFFVTDNEANNHVFSTSFQEHKRKIKEMH